MSPWDVPLLPAPQAVTPGVGAFRLDADVRIEVAASVTVPTRRAARQLQEAIQQVSGLLLPVVVMPGRSRAPALELRVAQAVSDGTPSAPAPDGPQGYRLEVTGHGVALHGTDEPGLFYGVQTLVQLIRGCGRELPAVEVHDAPATPVRGLLLDVSRGRVPTDAYLERLVRTLAAYKMNHLQLYVEHTFTFPRHPDIGRGSSALTPAQVRRLDRLCAEYHIELVPNLQSVGHLERMLAQPRYAHLAETAWAYSLATACDETFDLLGELYDDLLPCFTSSWFNVNADEPWDLGLGRSRELRDSVGAAQLYLQHVRRVHELVTARGRRMMMWADIVGSRPELVDRLPSDVHLLDWQYDHRDRYTSLDLLRSAGRSFWVCPGTSGWSSLYPRLDNAVANVRELVREGLAAGAGGMLMTDWGDGGHYQSPAPSWYPYLWAAETGWGGGVTDRADFDRAFDTQFLGDGAGAVTAALTGLGATVQDGSWTQRWNTATAWWEDPLRGRSHEVAPAPVVARTAAAARGLGAVVPRIRDAELRHDLDATAAQLCFVTDRVEWTRGVRALLTQAAADAGAVPDRAAAFAACLEQWTILRQRLDVLRAEFTRRWLASSQPGGLELNLARFDSLDRRWVAAGQWLSEQRDRYTRGEPVDAALDSLLDPGDHTHPLEGFHRRMMHLVDLVGYDNLPPDLTAWFPNPHP